MLETITTREFATIVKEQTGCAVIFAGSDSDKEHIEKIRKSLDDYRIPNLVRICSAHKQPRTAHNLIDAYNNLEGSLVFIAVAGGTDALSGQLSYLATRPVISCPPDGRNLSCISNPPGSSNAYIENPRNVGRYIAQLYADRNPRLREQLQDEILDKIQALERADTSYSKDVRLHTEES